MVTNKKHILVLLFFSILFSLMVNLPDLYGILLNHTKWVPVNTPPLSVGDEYHYFSVLKMITFGGYYGIPYDPLNGTLYLEFSRIIPYILNLPAYFIGSVLFDCRYGILFVRFFDTLLLFFAIHYFVLTINYSNNWKNNTFINISAVFLIFYGYHGLNTFFVQQDIITAISNFARYFGYIITDNFIYNNSTINDLNRAIVTSATAPIILFLFAIRIRARSLTSIQFATFLLILSFTSLPSAIAFGLISLALDILNKIDRKIIIQHLFTGLFLGITVIVIQTKLIFGMADSAKEAINLGFTFSFGWGYFTALFIGLLIILIAKKHLSSHIILTLLIFSFFQPFALIIGGEHGSRFWLRSNSIPFFVLLVHLTLTLLYFTLKKVENLHFLRNILFTFVVFVFGALIIVFSWRNTQYLLSHNERSVHNESLLSYILTDQTSSIIITNSPQIAMLYQLYSRTSTPLMGHFSLQSDGYKVNWTKTIVNFELMGVPEQTILNNIKVEAPKRHWLSNRENIYGDKQNFNEYYFDEILFASTYASYNHQMLRDGMLNKQKILQTRFYSMQLQKENIYTSLENKSTFFILDKKVPIFSNIKIVNTAKCVVF